MPCKNAFNCIILVVKFFIYKCKMEERNPNFSGAQSYLKFVIILKNLHVAFLIKIKF